MSRTEEQSLTPGRQDNAGRSDYQRAFRPPADRPRPYSCQDLQQRLERLPRGHPSSPYNADGSRKPPPPRLRDLELPLPGEDPADDAADHGEAAEARLEPLTDAEHAEHVRHVTDRLDWARREGLATERRFMDQDTGVWTRDRRDMHDALVEALYSRAADVPDNRMAVMAGGLPGAGKSTVLDTHPGVDESSYLTINPDVIKEEMAKHGFIPAVDGLTPMEASDLVHEESSHVAKLLAGRALADGKNVKWDITMSGKPSAEQRLDDLDRAGHETAGIFVDIPPGESACRADERYRRGHEDYRNGVGEGGRYLPPDVILAKADPEYGSANRRTFDEVKHRFVSWVIYDNSVRGREPLLAASSEVPESPIRGRARE